MNKARIYSIDSLRGLMALAVMIYHYSAWSSIDGEIASLWSILGLYAVTIFYFVSGFSMFFVYWDRPKFDTYKYASKRFFRLAPLFYFMSVVFILYQCINGQGVDTFKLLLNFTFLFSILDPSAYYSTGAWSIGNEMFFYAIFGAVLLSRDKTKSLTVLTIIALACFLTFRFYILDETQTLSSQWATYISPFNHLITFLMGGLAYFMMKKSRKFIEGGRYFFLIGSMFLFIHQVEGDRITLILGKEGLALLFSSYFLFLFFLSINTYKVFEFKFCTYFGDISYSLYLVHPLCWFIIEKVFQKLELALSGLVFWFFAIMLTLLISTVTYHIIEKTGIKLGAAFNTRILR